MFDKESGILNQFKTHSVSSGGEIYISTSELDTFIKVCQMSEAVIYSVELFRIVDGKIIPYEELVSIDSSQLFDDEAKWERNLSKCNGYISNCYKKISKDISGLYFNAVMDFQTD